MAERVQFHIESTIPEMEQMERIGLCTKLEIKRMIKKRKFLEYALRRRNKKKEHFLNYIQYEIAVLDLLKMRRKRLRINSKKQEIEYSIARRINKLFKAAIERFQNDIALWISQIEFCKRMMWHDTISSLFARMLQVLGSNPGLWILAAKWEMEENNAPENARRLLQRALRFHSNSQLLWNEYFRMELMYTDLALKRREILSVQEIKDVGNESDAVLQGGVALLVYKNATKAIPDIEFALSFIPICQHFDFTDSHVEEIFCDIQVRHPNSEETLDALARRPLFDLKKNAKCGKLGKAEIEADKQTFSLYEKAVEKVPSEKMWTFYINFTLSKMESAIKEKRKAKLCTKVIDLMERASTAACLLPDFYPHWASLVQARGDEETALSVALTACRMWPKKLKLWIFCLTLYIQTNQNKEQISELFDEALVNIKQKNSFPVWQLAVQWQSVVNPSELNNIFENGIMGCRNVTLPMKEMYLEMTALKKDVHAARDLYKRLRYMFPTSPKFYKKMIEIENAQLNSSIVWLRIYYEDAVREFGETDVDLWLDYTKLEVEHPDGKQTMLDVLYWRAMKALNEDLIEEFITRFTLRATGHESMPTAP